MLGAVWRLDNKFDSKIDGLRTELKSDIDKSHTELKEEIARSRTELKEDIAGLRGELKADIRELRADVKGVQAKVDDAIQRLARLEGKFDSRREDEFDATTEANPAA